MQNRCVAVQSLVRKAFTKREVEALRNHCYPLFLMQSQHHGDEVNYNGEESPSC